MRFSTIFGIIVLVFALFGTVMVIGSDNMIGYDSDTWHDDYSTDSLTSIPKMGDCYSYTEKVTYSANKDLNKRIKHELLIKSAAGSTFEVSDSGTGEDFSLTAEEYRKYIVSESFIKVQGLTDKTSEKTTTLKTAFGKRNVYCDTYSLPDTEELHYQTYKICYGEE